MWTAIRQKSTLNKFEIATAIVWLTTSTQTTAQTVVVASEEVAAEGTKALIIINRTLRFFSLRRELPLLVTFYTSLWDVIILFLCNGCNNISLQQQIWVGPLFTGFLINVSSNNCHLNHDLRLISASLSSCWSTTLNQIDSFISSKLHVVCTALSLIADEIKIV